MGRSIHVAVAILCVFSWISVAVAGEIIVTQSTDVTSKDVPLKFELEKTVWDGQMVHIWGKVSDAGSTKYETVRVVFTAKDASGKFLGRRTWFVDPSDIGPGQVGYIEDKFVDCDGQKPSKIEYSVVAGE